MLKQGVSYMLLHLAKLFLYSCVLSQVIHIVVVPFTVAPLAWFVFVPLQVVLQTCGGTPNKNQQFVYKEGRLTIQGDHPLLPSRRYVEPNSLIGSHK